MVKLFRYACFYLIPIFWAMSMTGCLKQKLDTPPDTTTQNPDLVVNTSIRELKLMTQRSPLKGVIISGIVTMNDKHGNYFKKLTIQDSTGGIEIEIGKTYFYADFPVGRRLFVKCDSLYLSEKSGMIQLGYQPDKNGYVQPIPAPFISETLFPGEYPVNVKPDTVSITQLAVPADAKRYLNKIVVIKNVEFVDSNINVPFALPFEISPSTKRIIEDCRGALITLQTSGHTDFQSIQTPAGKGTITALYTCFNEKPQLVIRDPVDIKFDGTRCSSLPTTGNILTILQLRQFFSGIENNVTLGDFKITGIVISDKNYKNTPSDFFILQGGAEDAGIMVRLNQGNPFNIGDSVLINVQGGKLKNYFGSLSLENLANNAIQLIVQGKSILSETVTVSQLQANAKSFDTRLVTIKGIHWTNNPATLNGNAGNLAFSDGTGEINHFCEQEAVFKNNAIHQNTASSITGYIFIRNNQVFLKMRNPDFPENDLKE